MLGRIIISSHAEGIESLEQRYALPFCGIDLFLEANQTGHEIYMPKQVVAQRDKVIINGRHYWQYGFYFDPMTLYPGHCLSKQTVTSRNLQYTQLTLYEQYALDKRLYDSQSTALFARNISSNWFGKRQKVLSNHRVSLSSDQAQFTPAYRHVVDLTSQQALERVLRAVEQFFSYRPHETHYSVQGLILSAKLVQASLAYQGKLYQDFESLITYYPRNYYHPRSPCVIHSKEDIRWQLNTHYQYLQMVVYLHQLIRRSLFRYHQDILGLDWLGYGKNIPEVLCRDIYQHLVETKQYSPSLLAHKIEYHIIRFANGYVHLPGVLRILPDQMALILMQSLLKQKTLNQKAIWRLMEGLKYHRIPPMPIEYLIKVYEQLVDFKSGRFVALNRFQLWVAYCLQQIPEDSIDLKIGEPQMNEIMGGQGLDLLLKATYNPVKVNKKQCQNEHQTQQKRANQVLSRIRHWFMHGS